MLFKSQIQLSTDNLKNSAVQNNKTFLSCLDIKRDTETIGFD